MSTYALNYSVWTGLVGLVLEYSKRKSGKWETLLMKGFAEKAIVGLISSYLQAQNLPVLGSGLDANYIYNGIIGALSEMYRHDRSKLQGAEEQILCALIGHRLASNFGMAFDSVTSNFGFINNMFAGSSGYQNATIPNAGMGIPSQNSGNNNPSGPV